MSDTVFILGAGASKEAGAPLMVEFLDEADRLLRAGQIVDDADRTNFELVAEARAALDAVHAKASIDADNLESVFGAFEMAALFRSELGKLSPGEVSKLPSAIRRVIVRTLEESITFTFDDPNRPVAPRPCNQFVDLIKAMQQQLTDVAIITFNYDLALDYAFWFNGMAPDYCLPTPPPDAGPPPTIPTPLTPTPRPTVKLLKLHGSLNWLPCSQERGLCNDIVSLPIQPDHLERVTGTAEGRLRLTRWLAHCPRCAAPSREPRPVIVPPTWNKGQHHEALAEVWREAAQELNTARTIVILGYSLPPTDQFFRYLYALGTLGDTRLQRFLVVDTNRGAEAVFSELLGRGVSRRFMFRQAAFGRAMAPMAAFLNEGKKWPDVV